MWCYFSMLIQRPRATLATLAHYMNHPAFGRVDFITGVGLSGTMPLMGLREFTGLPVLALRKEGTNSHGCITYRPKIGERYLIVDDFVSGGTTVNRIVRRDEVKLCRCAGVMLYQASWGYNTPREHDACPEGLPVVPLCDEIESVGKMIEEGYDV